MLRATPWAAKRAALFVAGQDRPQLVREAGQRLVQRHAAAARVGEDRVDAVVHQRLDQDVRSANDFLFRLGLGCSGHGRSRWGLVTGADYVGSAFGGWADRERDTTRACRFAQRPDVNLSMLGGLGAKLKRFRATGTSGGRRLRRRFRVE